MENSQGYPTQATPFSPLSFFPSHSKRKRSTRKGQCHLSPELWARFSASPFSVRGYICCHPTTPSSVWIKDPDAILFLFSEETGFFGKGCLSRSRPCFFSNVTPPSSDRPRSKGVDRSAFHYKQAISQRPRGSSDSSKDIEPLMLSDEEAFFLHHELHLLSVVGTGSFADFHVLTDLFSCDLPLLQPPANTSEDPIDSHRLWNFFCSRDRFFSSRFLAYRHYRSIGWVPKSGIKFGFDFVLYPREGPEGSHAE